MPYEVCVGGVQVSATLTFELEIDESQGPGKLGQCIAGLSLYYLAYAASKSHCLTTEIRVYKQLYSVHLVDTNLKLLDLINN